jgi:hypothetical protein
MDLADGPLGDVAGLLAKILDTGYLLYPLLGMIGAIKLVGLITSFLGLAAAAKAAAITGGIAKILLNPLAGLAAVGAAAAGGLLIASLLDKSDKAASPPKIKRYQNLGETEMVTLDRGSAMFDAGETVVRTDNFAKLTEGINSLINVTQDNKPHKPLAKWEITTRYR